MHRNALCNAELFPISFSNEIYGQNHHVNADLV